VAVRRRGGARQRDLIHALGDGARFLRPVFPHPAAWRVLDGGIAVVMSALAVSLAARGAAGA
jgi:L-lysine exporter family protein LysE/ArgO